MADVTDSDVTVTALQEDVRRLGKDGLCVRGSLSFGDGALTYDLSGGIPLPKGVMGAVSEIKDFWIKKVDAGQDLQVRFDKDSQALRLYAGLRGNGINTLTITDDDSAASNGTDLYVVKPTQTDGNMNISHLRSVCAGNADSYFQLGANGPTCVVEDSDTAASEGVALYVDENDNKLLADLDLADDKDVFLQLSDGSLLRVYDDDSASSNGVALHFDDDGATASERVLCVTAGDADDTVTQELGNDVIVPPVNVEFTAIVA